MQVQDQSQIQPALTGPDIADVASLFLVWTIRREILLQQVRRNVERVIAVQCSLVFLRSDDFDAILTHQTAHKAVPDAQPRLLLFFSHPGPHLALQAKLVLLTNVGQKRHIILLSLARLAYPPDTQSTRCVLA